jgi:hypothetical protein
MHGLWEVTIIVLIAIRGIQARQNTFVLYLQNKNQILDCAVQTAIGISEIKCVWMTT